jgi:hypothetical protein
MHGKGSSLERPTASWAWDRRSKKVEPIVDENFWNQELRVDGAAQHCARFWASAQLITPTQKRICQGCAGFRYPYGRGVAFRSGAHHRGLPTLVVSLPSRIE